MFYFLLSKPFVVTPSDPVGLKRISWKLNHLKCRCERCPGSPFNKNKTRKNATFHRKTFLFVEQNQPKFVENLQKINKKSMQSFESIGPTVKKFFLTLKVAPKLMKLGEIV